MKTFLRMMKYLMYGVFALLFMMSWAFLGKEPDWVLFVFFNAPALLFISIRLLISIIRSRSRLAITLFMISWVCLEITIFSGLILSFFALTFIGTAFFLRLFLATTELSGFDFDENEDLFAQHVDSSQPNYF